MNNLEFMWNLKELDILIDMAKQFFMVLATYYIFSKIINKNNLRMINIAIMIVTSILFSIITVNIEHYSNSFYSILMLLFLITLTNKVIFREELIYSIITTIISFGINYAIYSISVILAFIPVAILKINNDYINLFLIAILYCMFIYKTFRIKKVKHGIDFLQKRMKDSYFNMLIFNIATIILFLDIFLQIIPILEIRRILATILILLVAMGITIKQSFDLYYKQKQLIKDYEETKAELEKEKKEKQEFKDKLLKDSKARHSVVYKQDSLEEKMDKILQLDSISEDEKEKLKVEFGKISDEVYKEPGRMELAKTDIPLVDDMLEHMQTKCIKNKIDFELQIVGDIHYMVNHLVTEDELRILLADHIKDAIIAINSSDNTNRSILVRLGKIDNVYSVYIYDSGVEFTKEVLDKLGKEPITTHEDTGGTGMGFMNTFDLLKKYDASLTIKEIGIPTKDNYTKVLMFKFDNQGEFKVESYKNENLTVQKS